MHLVVKLYKNLRCSFKQSYSWCCSQGQNVQHFQHAKVSANNFCDGLEKKFASPSDGIQQAGAKSVTPCLLSVSDYKRIYTSFYFIITTSTRSL